MVKQDVDSPDIYEKNWHALNVRSRHEKIVDQLLAEKGIEIFLPMRPVQRKWSDRKKIVYFPLFSGYLFVHSSLDQKRTILMTRGVVRIIGRPHPIVVPQEQIDSIKRFVEVDVEIDPYPHLTAGRLVEVKRGPFKGLKGVLERKKGKYRIIINVQLINQSAGVEIDVGDVEPCD